MLHLKGKWRLQGRRRRRASPEGRLWLGECTSVGGNECTSVGGKVADGKWRQKTERRWIQNNQTWSSHMQPLLPPPAGYHGDPWWLVLRGASRCWLNQEQDVHASPAVLHQGSSSLGGLGGPYWEGWEVLTGRTGRSILGGLGRGSGRIVSWGDPQSAGKFWNVCNPEWCRDSEPNQRMLGTFPTLRQHLNAPSSQTKVLCRIIH